MKNTGKPSQKEFEAIIALMGKKALLRRFSDMAEVRALNPGVNLKFPAQPADYLLTIEGLGTHYAEVKSSTNERYFNLSQIEKEQWRCAKQQVTAGGDYFFYLHSVKHGIWYRVPAKYFLFYRDTKNNFKWDELEEFKWKPVTSRT